MQMAKANTATENNRIYNCPKCNKSFGKFDEFNKHNTQGLCKDGEKKAFCIAFKGAECVSAQKRINFTVDDYYYGHLNGSSSYKKKSSAKKFSCYSCGKVLRNNIRFMSHVRHKIENEWKDNDNVNDFNICSHCYRHYTSPFHLQCHIETVHATVPAATTCRICELNFENEQVFLMHMKDRHTYNEMPYVCKLCSYRSSFYLELIHHFRIAHENCSSLLCPFCLAIHQTANSYLSHVIQHMSKSVRCTQCRLQFFTQKDKNQHVISDHPSVFQCSGKKSLPKNPNQYMIFVKVSHHPLSPTKSNATSQKQSPQLNKRAPEIANVPSSTDGWTFSSQYDAAIPLEYRPYARESRVFVVLSFDALRQTVTNCIECGENLGVFVANYNKHFQREYHCRKCPFLSRCFKALKKHILVFHLKQEYDPKKDVKAEDPIKQLMKKTKFIQSPPIISPPPPVVSTPVKAKGDQDYYPDGGVEANEASGSGLRRSSRQPPKPKLKQENEFDFSPSSDTSGDEPETTKKTPPKSSPLLSKSSPETNEAAGSNIQKPGAKKRKITDINSLLKMKEQEQENERASKQRRKQLKPQKVDVDEKASGISSQASLPDSNQKVASSCVQPPPLDSLFPADMDFSDETDVSKDQESSSADRNTPPPKLKVKFASHLGLSKKKATVTPVVKPFVNPRSASHVFPPLPNLLTSSCVVMTSSESVKPSSVPKISLTASAPKVVTAATRIVNSVPTIISSVPRIATSAPPPVINRAPFPTPSLRKQAPGRTARKKVPSSKPVPKTNKTLPFGAQTMGGVMMKQPNITQILDAPRMLRFTEVTNSSFLVSWLPPLRTDITEFKLVFQGSGLPTTQRLPSEQTSVRLIGLRSNTLYLVQLCSVYRFLQSAYVKGLQRTLPLRELKSKHVMKKIDEVIVLDDEDEDVLTVKTKDNTSKTDATTVLNTRLLDSTNKLMKKPSNASPILVEEEEVLKDATSSGDLLPPSKEALPGANKNQVTDSSSVPAPATDSNDLDSEVTIPDAKESSSVETADTDTNSKVNAKIVKGNEVNDSLKTLPKSETKSLIVVPDVTPATAPSKSNHIDAQKVSLDTNGASNEAKTTEFTTNDSAISTSDKSENCKTVLDKISLAIEDDENDPQLELNCPVAPDLGDRLGADLRQEKEITKTASLNSNEEKTSKNLVNAIEVSVDVHHGFAPAKSDSVLVKKQENSLLGNQKDLKCLQVKSDEAKHSKSATNAVENVGSVRDHSDILEEIQDRSVMKSNDHERNPAGSTASKSIVNSDKKLENQNFSVAQDISEINSNDHERNPAGSTASKSIVNSDKKLESQNFSVAQDISAINSNDPATVINNLPQNGSESKQNSMIKDGQNDPKLQQNHVKEKPPKSPDVVTLCNEINAAVANPPDQPSVSNHVQNHTDDGLSIAEKVRLSSRETIPAKRIEPVKSTDSAQEKDSTASKASSKATSIVDTNKQTLSIQDLDNILSFLEETD